MLNWVEDTKNSFGLDIVNGGFARLSLENDNTWHLTFSIGDGNFEIESFEPDLAPDEAKEWAEQKIKDGLEREKSYILSALLEFQSWNLRECEEFDIAYWKLH